MNNPKMVLISDIHFNLNNLELSSKALIAARDEAEKLSVPLVICGDTNDTKAIIRAEVANALISILKDTSVEVLMLVGNHDLVNEKGDEHGLNYLAPYAWIIDKPGVTLALPGVHFIPYQNSSDKFTECLSKVKTGSIIVMHQGVRGAEMGDYVIDKTSVEASELSSFTCLSGHYHRHQTIGTVTYIGNPFTMSFGESNDGPKGFLVVYEDGSFKQIALDYRKHIIIDLDVDKVGLLRQDLSKDLVWVKAHGKKSSLDKLDKKKMGEVLGTQNFKLDKIYTDTSDSVHSQNTQAMSNEELFDSVIEELQENVTFKNKLRKLWREAMSTDEDLKT